MENIPENKILKFCNDKHIFCKECMLDYVNSIVEDEENDMCININCPYCRKKIDYRLKKMN